MVMAESKWKLYLENKSSKEKEQSLGLFKNYKISMAQIDPNGLCNVGCWFCPVGHAGNPVIGRKNMPIEMLENILKQLAEGRGDFVSDSFDFIYTAHYNEVLLYKYFPEMLDLFRKYSFKTMILTNGTPLTKERTDLIKSYSDVVYGICFNTPSSDSRRWAETVGMNEKIFSKLINNISYAIQELPEMVAENRLTIQVNGMNKMSLFEYGGWLDKLKNAPDLDMDPENGTLAQEVAGFKKLFPTVNAYPMPNLVDRAGHLDKQEVITNKRGIEKFAKQNKSKVIGCANGREVGGRPNGWLHVNANGDVFICCNDFDFDTIFANVNEKTLKEIWHGPEHENMIAESYNSICTTCSAAIWGD
jgi:MoaA/NifB/PqqE/SkfB family radical SAM enzyme